jgi:hypothetical protein
MVETMVIINSTIMVVVKAITTRTNDYSLDFTMEFI